MKPMGNLQPTQDWLLYSLSCLSWGWIMVAPLLSTKVVILPFPLGERGKKRFQNILMEVSDDKGF